MRCQFKMVREVRSDWISPSGWHLLLQWGIYKYSDKTEERGYRFVYRKPDGKLQTRGQARIPSLRDAQQLILKARDEGWGGHLDEQQNERLELP